MIFITCILCCALVFFMGVKFGWKKLNCRCCRLLKGSRSTNTHVTTERQLSSCEDMITIHHHSPAFTLLSQSKIGEGTPVFNLHHMSSQLERTPLNLFLFVTNLNCFVPKHKLQPLIKSSTAPWIFPTPVEEEEEEEELCSNSSIICMLLESLHL